MEEIIAMGFEKSRIEAALIACSNDINAAVDLLLTGEEKFAVETSHVSYYRI